MKFECAYTNLDGLKVSLAVSAPISALEPLAGTSEEPSLDPHLVASAFERSIPQLSLRLLQAHVRCALDLQASCVKVLQKDVDGIGQQSAEEHY